MAWLRDQDRTLIQLKVIIQEIELGNYSQNLFDQ